MRQRLLLFCGDTGAVFAFDLATATWSTIAAAGGPGARARSAAIYDPVHDRMVLVGGKQSGAIDAWSLSLAGVPAWTQLSPSGSPPSQPWPWMATYDSVRGRMLIYGGNFTRFDPVEPFALSLDAPPAWTALALSPLASYGSSVIAFDAARDRMVLHGGGYSSGLGFFHGQYETWELSFASSLSVPPALGSLSRVLGARPNPGRSDQAIQFEIASGAGPASLEIFTIAGQRVWQRDVSGLGPGAHAMRWEGVDTHGHRCAPGVYWARIVTRDAAPAQRFVRLQ
jgi:hypothetical protein